VMMTNNDYLRMITFGVSKGLLSIILISGVLFSLWAHADEISILCIKQSLVRSFIHCSAADQAH
jgi:hypothetical protein